jgi:hypothetical protein
VQARKHSSHGSGWLDPVEAENALLFVTAKGNYIRDFAFDYNANAFVGVDVSEYARTSCGVTRSSRGRTSGSRTTSSGSSETMDSSSR